VRKIIGLGLIVAALGLSGCLSWQTPVRLKVKSEPSLNLDSDQQSLPVVLRVYQLKDPQAFAQASFDELWKQDKAVLGSSLLSVQELVVYPDRTERYDLSRSKGVRHLGLMATFRQPESGHWKQLVRVSGGMLPRSLPIHVENSQMTLSK